MLNDSREEFFASNEVLTRRVLLPGAKITALGTYVPPGVLTNADLEKMVETSNEWIMERVGIAERHIAAPDIATSDMAIEAARLACPIVASTLLRSMPLSCVP